MQASKYPYLPWAVIAVLAAMVFAIDLMIPLGVAGGVPYVAVVLVALWLPKRRDLPLVALACAAMTLLGWWLSPVGGEAWKVAFNRGLALFAIGVTAVLSDQYRISLEARLRSLSDRLPSITGLPIKGFTVALLLTAGVCVGLGLDAWMSYQKMQGRLVHSVRLLESSSHIARLDEALTMSVQMAAATGERRWHVRYEELETQLDAALKEAMRLAPELHVCEEVAQIQDANDQLVALEKGAFGKIQTDDLDEAKAILASPAYLQQKGIYARGIGQLVANMKSQATSAQDAQRIRTFGTLAAVAVAVPGLICAWLYVLGTLRQYLAQRKQAEEALKEAHDQLEYRVEQRTQELEISNRQLQQEIVDRKQVDQALRRSEHELRLVTDNVAGMIAYIDAQGRYRFVNRRYAQWIGRAAGQIIAKHVQDVLPDSVYQRAKPKIDLALQGQYVTFENELPLAVGGKRHVTVDYVPDTDPNGTVSGFFILITDITDRKQKEQLYRALYDDNPSMLFTVDPSGIVMSANRFGADQLGYTPDQLVGQSVFKVVYDADRQILRDHLAECVNHPQQLHRWEFRKVCRDGAIMWVREAGRCVPGQNGEPMVLIVCEDITEQRQARELIQLQKQVLEITAKGVDLNDILNTLCRCVEQMVPQATCAIMLVDQQDKVLRVAAGARGSEDFVAAFDGLVPGERAGSCGTAAHLGKLVVVADTSKDARWARFRMVAQRFGIKSAWSMPFCSNDKTVVGTFAVSRPVVGVPDPFELRILQLASSLASIVEGRMRSQEQAERHQAELAHVTRLSTVGELASGLAHEINQPLAAISNYVQVCARDVRLDDWDKQELIATLNKASQQCHRASQIIRRLRQFITKEESHRSKVNVNKIVHEAIELVKGDARSHRVKINMNLDKQLAPVEVDGIQIEQVVINLVKNSIEAMSDGRVNQREMTIQTAPLDGGAVKVSVQDTGLGIPAGFSGKVFEPFFTTKPRGMGMGLSISRTIIEAHGGRMMAVAEPDRGAKFEFTLPTNAGTM